MPLLLIALLALAEAAPAALRLQSGLLVLSEEVAGAEELAFELRISAGAGEDPPGRAGMAHLVEHASLGPEQALGLEGVTTHDATRFVGLLPPDRLDAALDWARGALSPSAALEAGPLELERAAVRREILVGAVRPAEQEARRRGETLYPPGHPYHLPAAGTEEGVAAITAADATSWRSRRYGPDQAVLALVGALPADLQRRLHEALSALPAPSAPAPPRAAAPARPAAWPRRHGIVGARSPLTLLFALPLERSEEALTLAALLLERDFAARGVPLAAAALHRRLGRELVLRLGPAVPRRWRLLPALSPELRLQRWERRLLRGLRRLGSAREEDLAWARAERARREDGSLSARAARLAAAAPPAPPATLEDLRALGALTDPVVLHVARRR